MVNFRAMITPAPLKILTLNCWGIPYFSKKRAQRIKAIINTIKKSDWDVVALQEVWLKNDRLKIEREAGFKFVTSFENKKLIGSGMMLLSRYEILETSFYEFCAKGLSYKLKEFDFHTGKGIGFASIKTPFGVIPFFNTHLIADYSAHSKSASNRIFRLAQIAEVVAFVESKVEDSFIFCGDLNTSENDLEFRLFSTRLRIKKLFAQESTFDNKRRIDHILVGSFSESYKFEVMKIQNVLTEVVESIGMKHSDHEGISAHLLPSIQEVEEDFRINDFIKAVRYSALAIRLLKAEYKKIMKVPHIGGLLHRSVLKQESILFNLLKSFELRLEDLSYSQPSKTFGVR
jgi:sphingomyelin phosphodiesterase 2